MRILFGIHTWHPEGRGGTEVHALAAAQGLMERGHQVGVFTRTGRPDRPEYEVTTEWHGKIGVTRINNTFRDSQSLEWVYKNERIHDAFLRELAEFKADLVHLHHLTTLSTTVVEAAKLQGYPVVMTLHDFWTLCPRGQRMTRELKLCEDIDRNECISCLSGLWPHFFSEAHEEPVIVDIRGRLSPAKLAEWDRHMVYVMNLCDVLICPSEFHRERMLDFPIDPERIIALPHGMDDTKFGGATREPRAPVNIGFIGSVIPVKGVHVLIEAFKLLGREDLHLHIHGDRPSFHDDGSYAERLDALAEGMPNVTFHGAYDEPQVAEILSGLDVLVVPSLWWETYCLTIREGLLAGIPVIASDLGAMREALDGERDGLLFRPNDAEDLKDKLQRVLDDDALRARLSNRGVAVKAQTLYLDELEQVYRQAVEIARRRHATLVVAPPSFPQPVTTEPDREPLVAVPWDDLGVAVKQTGRAHVSLATQLPDDADPQLTLGVVIRDGDAKLGEVDLVVDLEPLTRRVAAQPADAEDADSKLRKRRTRRRGTRERPVPEGGPVEKKRTTRSGVKVRRVAVKGKRKVQKQELPHGKRVRHSWRPPESGGIRSADL